MIVAFVTVTVLPILIFFGVQRYQESIPYYSNFILGERDLWIEIFDLIE